MRPATPFDGATGDRTATNAYNRTECAITAAGNFMAKNATCNAADNCTERAIGLAAIGVAIFADECLVAMVPGFRRRGKRERGDKGQCSDKLVNNFHFNLRYIKMPQRIIFRHEWR